MFKYTKTIDKLQSFYIDGKWAPSNSNERLSLINPATEESIGQIALANETDVEIAVATAAAAFKDYCQSSVKDRIDLLQNILTIYEQRIDEFALAISIEMGAPIDFARSAQAQAGIDHLSALIEDVKAYEFERKLRNGDTIVMEPIGVCGLITPWNWPINQIVLKVAPALAAGCTMVLKPSELTPLSAILFTEVMHQAGVPNGVFNMIHGLGQVAGSALSKHPNVAMISFTGSTGAGRSIIHNSAERIAKTTLELGGKSPNLIFADCELSTAIDQGIDACFINSGQSCDAATRMLIERSVYEKSIELARSKCERISVGDPAKSGNHLGPLVSKIQFDRVQSLITCGLEEGARCISGGIGKPKEFQVGYYARPTIFADVKNTMKIAREEIFGPILCMMPFDSEKEAIELANDNAYGLAAYIQTLDQTRAQKIARLLRSGSVNINNSFISPGSPFGGYKLSGNGREGGAEGINEYLEVKVIASH